MHTQPRKRRTNADRQYDRYELLRARLLSAYSHAAHFHLTHEQLLVRVSAAVWDTPECKCLTGAYRSMLGECRRCLSDMQYQQLEWVLGTADGPIPEGRGRDHDWTTGRLSELAHTPGALFGAHYWKDTNKLFGEWKCINALIIAIDNK